MGEIESKWEDYLKPLLGDMAPITINSQKDKLGLHGELSGDDYVELAEGIKELCAEMAGDVIAAKIYDGLLSIIDT